MARHRGDRCEGMEVKEQWTQGRKKWEIVCETFYPTQGEDGGKMRRLVAVALNCKTLRRGWWDLD